MAYLIADSGSTKTEWLLFDKNGIIKTCRTLGINADIVPMSEIKEILIQDLKAEEVKVKPDNLWFYAASMSNHRSVEELTEVLKEIFPTANIEVEHDLLAAARALCQDEPGIACILGTGSNSAMYDGEKITKEIGGQGYLFSDEGSGADLGKTFLGKMLTGYLDPDFVAEIENWSGLTKLEIRKKVYQSPKPNVYLASWSNFIFNHLSNPVVKGIIKDRFRAFFRETVLRYPDVQKYKVHFIGSVGFLYKEVLLEVCDEIGLQTGRILKSPMDGLMEYHMKTAKS